MLRKYQSFDSFTIAFFSFLSNVLLVSFIFVIMLLCLEVSMKKIFLILFMTLWISGCTKIQNQSLEEIADKGIHSSVKITNMNRTGYKYYLPNGMKAVTKKDYNEVICNDKYPFYLYVDVISYYNKVKANYEVNSKYYQSFALSNGDKFGYLQIKSLENKKYFIEIMYNYAKIEVIVTKRDIEESVAYAIAILDSVTYIDTVLGSLMGDNVLNSNELEYNIFDTAKTESNYLEIVEQYDQYNEKDKVPDMDFIK